MILLRIHKDMAQLMVLNLSMEKTRNRFICLISMIMPTGINTSLTVNGWKAVRAGSFWSGANCT